MPSKHDPKSQAEDQPGNSGWDSPRRVQTLVLIIAIAFGIYLCYRMALPFLPALTWAMALAILFAPLHRWLESKVRRANLAAGITVLLVALLVVVPTTFMGQRLLQESARGPPSSRQRSIPANGDGPSKPSPGWRLRPIGSSARSTCPASSRR